MWPLVGIPKISKRWGSQIHNKTMKQYNKPRKSGALFGLGFLETIPSPRLGFLGEVFLAIF